jgi:hypothetical protein
MYRWKRAQRLPRMEMAFETYWPREGTRLAHNEFRVQGTSRLDRTENVDHVPGPDA